MFRLEIRTGNDAFAESPEIEVARILLDVVRSIGRGATGSHPVRDLNGNAVGSFDFEPDDDELCEDGK